MPGTIVYLNGEFIAAQDAAVSVFDRGFLFGDGVYEVIPAYMANTVGVVSGGNAWERPGATPRVTCR